jgi:N-dimethylarginine dimethylaminohydrolase
MFGKIESVIIKRPEDAFIGPQNLANHWQAFNYTACPDYEKAVLEFGHFVQVLKRHVAKIYYLPRHEKAGLDSIYTHDPVKITRRRDFHQRHRRTDLPDLPGVAKMRQILPAS